VGFKQHIQENHSIGNHSGFNLLDWHIADHSGRAVVSSNG
jgi:hypothetical protein